MPKLQTNEKKLPMDTFFHKFNKISRTIILFIMDIILSVVCLWSAHAITAEKFGIRNSLNSFLGSQRLLIIFLVLMSVSFAVFQIYSISWRYASYNEYLKLFFAIMIPAYFSFITIHILYGADYTGDKPVCFVLWILLFMFAVIFSRLILVTIRTNEMLSFFRFNDSREKIIIIGAGYTGTALLRTITNDTKKTVMAFIDDDVQKHGLIVANVPVVGDRYSIPETARKYKANEIILAIPSSEKREHDEIIKICQKTKCKISSVPSLYELLSGKAAVNQINDVNPTQLLGRNEILVDNNDIFGYIAHQTIMVTGGGGSIGSELCRQIAKFNPKTLIVFDIYENNAYELQHELKTAYPHLDLVVLIGSVRDISRLDAVFAEYKPNVVFHAAAHKHVPLMEDSPNEAVKNNVFGTYNVALTAEKHKVDRFVLISTDKAVNPTNIMGTSKRVAEMVIQQLAERNKDGGTKFTAVRFGNVLGSNGSVIPLFKKQIAAGGPVTVTHPEINRFFMTIPEASQLVIQAGAFAKGGETFILDMGEPVKIVDLAKNLIRLSGMRPDEDIKIEFTGLRPGEKMYEEILLDKAKHNATKHNKIFIEKPVTEFNAVLDEIKSLRNNITCDCTIYDEMIGWFTDTFKE